MLLAELSLYENLKNVFENNFINWVVLIIGLYFIWNKYIAPILTENADKTKLIIADAKKANQEASLNLDEQKQKFAKLDASVNQIINEAHDLANELIKQSQLETQTKISQIQEHTANLVLDTKKNFINEVRQAVVESAFQTVSENLPNLLGDELVRKKQVDLFIQDLQKLKQIEEFTPSLESQLN